MMKHAKLWIGLLGLAAMVAGWQQQAHALTETISGIEWTYTVSNSATTITGANPASGDITIPSMLGGFSVTEIGDHAFSGCCGLHSVKIPDSVLRIGKDAFSDCSQWTGGLGESHIDGLERVVLGNGVTNIGERAFAWCEVLSDISWGSRVQCIGDEAFEGCILTALEIPDSVEVIGSEAFRNCPIQTINIGANTKFIGERAFSVALGFYTADAYWGGWQTAGLSSISVDEKNASYEVRDGVLFSKDGKTLLLYPGQLFRQSYVIPNRVESIREEAFYHCTNLVNITIPDGVTSIGDGAFSCCENLSSLSIPNGAENIGNSMFNNCNSLTEVTIPDSVKNIGDEAFRGCSSLTEVSLPDSVTNIGKYAFSRCNSLTEVTIPDSVTDIGGGAFDGCSGLTSVTIPDGVKNIGDEAFRGCSSLTEVLLPDSVTNIGEYAFSGCSRLKEVTIPNSVTGIGNHAFFNCSGLKEVAIPGSVTNIGISAFEDCSGLNALTLGNGVSSIGRSAFKGCTNLVSLRIPTSVRTGLGWETFDDCTELIAIAVDALNPTYASEDGILFSKDKSLLIVCPAGKVGTCSIPADVSRIQEYAFNKCRNLTSVLLGDGVENIGNRAFSGCSGLTSVAIPDSVTSIGSSAFSGCSNLVAVTIGNSVTNIGSNAFSGCSGLTELTIPDSVTNIGNSAFYGCGRMTSLEAPTSWYGTNKLTNTGLRGDCEVVYRGILKLEVATDALPPGTVGTEYETALEGTGGAAPYAWSRPDAAYLETSRPSTYTPTGTAQGWQSNDACWDLALPFEFPFFGNTYTNVKVNSNGALSFGTEDFTDYYASSNTFYHTPIIAVWWEWLFMTNDWSSSATTGDVYVDGGDGWIKVEWRGMWYRQDYFDPDFWWWTQEWVTTSFSATLHEDGRIVLSYGDYNDGSGTIALSAGDGKTFVLQEASRSPYDDIVFEPSGDLPPGVELTADGVLKGTPWRSGEYAFRAIVTDVAGMHTSRMLSLPVAFADLGEGAAVHTGAIEEDETWKAGTVHVVDAKVTVRNGATVTIEPGAVVKFTPESTLVVNGGGRCVAEGVVFTHLHDDAVGGDTMGDGTSKVPVLDEYSIKGSVVADLATEWRWLSARPSETWRAGKVYVVDGTLTVAGGTTLTIEAGAVVKFTSGSSLVVSSNGTCVAYGAIFTHIDDDTVGGDTMGDGNDTTPTDDEYSIVGNVLKDGETEMRYLTVKTSGTLSGSNTWGGHKTYQITGNLTVGNGAVLNILPGAIVKFASGCQLTVNGTLSALGTRAAPIVFTSLKDDEHGGDSNGDGDKTTPQPGDWHQITGNGTVDMDHCQVLWCSAQNNQGALYPNGGTWTFNNSTVAHCEYDCMRSYGGTFSAMNSVFMDSSMGAAPSGGTARFVNCVFHDLTTAVRWGNGTFINCIFAAITQDIIDTKFYSSTLLCKFSHCCFWNPESTGDHASAKVGQDGNFYADPLFADAGNGDFRLSSAASPCVDAADTTQAPETDAFGRPRMNVPGATATGVPDANGVYADIGLYELDGTMPGAAPDLKAETLEIPAAAMAGEEIEIAYKVANVGGAEAKGTWRDGVSFVSPYGTAVAGGTVATTAAIEPGGAVTVRQRLRVPPLEEGGWTVRVDLNAWHDLFEGAAAGANRIESEMPLAVTLAAAALGKAETGTISAGVPFARKFEIPAGKPHALRISAPAGSVVRIGVGGMPSESETGVTVGADGTVVASLPAGATVYVSLSGDRAGAVKFEPYPAGLSVLGVTPGTIPTAGGTTLSVSGLHFASGVSVRLAGTAGTVAATETRVLSAERIDARFDGAALAPGAAWAVVVEDGDGNEARLENAVRTSGEPARPGLSAKLDMPSSLRPGRSFVFYIDYANTGNVDIPAPVFTVSSDQMVFTTDYGAYTNSVQLLGLGAEGLAGVLKPGETFRMAVKARVKPTAGGTVSYSLKASWIGSPDAAKPLQLESLVSKRWVYDHFGGEDGLYVALSEKCGATWAELYANLGTFLNGFMVSDGVLPFDVAAQTLAQFRIAEILAGMEPETGSKSRQNRVRMSAARSGDSNSEDWEWLEGAEGTGAFTISTDNSDPGDFWEYRSDVDWWHKPRDSYAGVPNIAIVTHGLNDSIHGDWALPMARALSAKGYVVLCIDHGDHQNQQGVLGIPFDPFRPASFIPQDALIAYNNLVAHEVDGRNVELLVGHSHGGHFAGHVAQHFQNAGQKPKRLIGLDTSPLFTHPGGIWPNGFYSWFYGHDVTAARFPSPSAWNTESAEKVEFYKSSWWYSMGSDHLEDEVYGLPSFFVVEDKKGSFKGDAPLTANPHHGFSRTWFTSLVEHDEKKMLAGYGCDKLYEEYSGIGQYERGTFAGVLRYDGKRGKAIMECGAVCRDELGVEPGSWRLDEALGHQKTMHELQNRMALLTEYRMDDFSIKGSGAGRLVNGEDATASLVGLQNAADNISTHFPSLVAYSTDRPWELLNDDTGLVTAVSPQIWAFELSGVPDGILAKARRGITLTKSEVLNLSGNRCPLLPSLSAISRKGDFIAAQERKSKSDKVSLNIKFGKRQAGRTADGEAKPEGEEVLFVAIAGSNRPLGRQDSAPSFYPYDLCHDDCIAKIMKVYDGEIPPLAHVRDGTSAYSSWPISISAPIGAITPDNNRTADASGAWSARLTGIESTSPTNIVCGRWSGEDCAVSEPDWSSNPNVIVSGVLPMGGDGQPVPVHSYTVSLTVRDANGKTNVVEYAFEIHRKPEGDEGDAFGAPDGDSFGGGSSAVPQSCDPNEMAGPEGTGPKRVMNPGDWMNYTVYFENKADASAPAQFVTVDTDLSPQLDWTTFEMGDVGFGLQTDTGLRGLRNGTSEVQMEGTNLSVRTEVALDAESGHVTWFLRVVTPDGDEDGWPYADDPTGFLPPNDLETHCGEGHITYRVKVKADATENARIDASATIVFDYNDPIPTDPAWWNTVAWRSFAVKFNANGGTGTMAAQRIPRDAATKLSANKFKRSGFAFIGWSRSKTGKVEYADAASVKNLATAGGNVTLYAQWAKNAYKVAFNANGGTGKMAAQAMTYGKAAKLRKNAFTKKDSVFIGWATSKSGKVAYKNAQAVKNLRTDGKTTTLYAKWAKKNYTVAFNANGGTGSMKTQAMTYNKAAKLTKNAFTRNGWTFLGWSKTKTGAVAYKNAQAVKNLRTDGKTTTLYAVWAKNAYKVAFNANGGTGSMAAQKMTYGKAAKLRKNAFKRTGYTFAGWGKTAGGAVAYKDAASVKNLRTDGGTTTLYAKWTATTYKVAFNANGGTGTMATQSVKYDTAAKLAANAFTRDGFTFAGWAKTATGAVAYKDAASVKNLRSDGGTVTLFAVWAENPKTETTSTPVAVPYAWLDGKAASFVAANGGDYEAAAKAKAANGVNTVWECYVVGLDPEKADAAFTAELSIVDGKPVVTSDPAGQEGRRYTVEAKKALADGNEEWTDVTGNPDPEADGYRFFRVGVSLPQ